MPDAASLPSPEPAGRAAAWRRLCPRFAGRVLVALVLVDAVFVFLHVLHRLKVGPFADLSFDLTRDGGHPEVFQYLKALTIAAVLAALAWRHRSATFGVWALVFLYLALDDALSIHERGGARLAGALALSPAWGLRAIDLGELIVLAATACAVALAVAALMLRGRAGLRRVSRDLLVLLALLAAFGVGVDALHAIAMGHGWLGLGMVEDGGEMLVMSLIVAHVLWRARTGVPVFQAARG